MIIIKMFIHPKAINDGALELGQTIPGTNKPQGTFLVEVDVSTDIYNVTGTPDPAAGIVQYQVVKKK